MKTPSSLATLAFALLASHAQAIDFHLRSADTLADGNPVRLMYFSDGAQRIYYDPPARWERSGDAQAATFRPKNLTQATVKIENSPADHARIPLDEAGIEVLRKFARTLLPAEATDVGEIWEVTNPTVLQGWTSFEVGFDYSYFGRHFCRSVLFINLDSKRQVHFIVDAIPAEFDALYKTTYRTLATWWEPKGGATQ
jgi:hypothetical protein